MWNTTNPRVYIVT